MILNNSFGLISSVGFLLTPQHRENGLHDTLAHDHKPQVLSPRYTADDGMTGENCDMADDSLQDYDDGGDNSTYPENH